MDTGEAPKWRPLTTQEPGPPPPRPTQGHGSRGAGRGARADARGRMGSGLAAFGCTEDHLARGHRLTRGYGERPPVRPSSRPPAPPASAPREPARSPARPRPRSAAPQPRVHAHPAHTRGHPAGSYPSAVVAHHHLPALAVHGSPWRAAARLGLLPPPRGPALGPSLLPRRKSPSARRSAERVVIGSREGQ